MGDDGWWPIIAFVTLVNPVVIVAGIASGLLVRRWWQVVLGLIAVPVAYWIYCAVFLLTDHFVELLPLLASAGVIWTAAVFSLKKAAAS
jgi:hypothetical protein